MINSAIKSIVLGGLEGAEAFYDYASTNEALDAVPIVSTAVRFLEAANDFRSHLLQNKLKKFLTEPSLLRSLKAQKLRGKILGNPDDLVRIGDTLFLVIDKVTDSDKPVILAKVYAHLLVGGISLEDFFLLSHCIDICALSDLRSFIAFRGDVNALSDAGMVRLATAGLARTEVTNSNMFPSAHGGSVRLYFVITEIGQHLISAIDASSSA